MKKCCGNCCELDDNDGGTPFCDVNRNFKEILDTDLICENYSDCRVKQPRKISKHIPKIIRTVRVAVCIVISASILFSVGIVNNVFKYIFIRWNLDILQNNLDSSLSIEYLYIVLIWNYVVGFFIIGLIIKYFTLPRITFIGKFYERFIDSYYDDE